MKLKPFAIVGVFWLVLLMFVMAGYSGDFGFAGITGYAVNESGEITPMGLQSIAIMILFFTNILTMFFLAREMAKK